MFYSWLLTTTSHTTSASVASGLWSKGVELVLTLGTGVGSSLFVDGRLVPNVEVGRNRLRKAQLERVGEKVWNNRFVKIITKLEKMFHYDRLYLGVGNAALVDINRLPANVTIVSNMNGLSGGIALWRDGPDPGSPKVLVISGANRHIDLDGYLNNGYVRLLYGWLSHGLQLWPRDRAGVRP